MNFDALVKARIALQELWKASQLRGRCWGPVVKGNPYKASNITIADGNELITICQNPDGTLKIHEFRQAKTTCLGDKVRKILTEAGLPLIEAGK